MRRCVGIGVARVRQWLTIALNEYEEFLRSHQFKKLPVQELRVEA